MSAEEESAVGEEIMPAVAVHAVRMVVWRQTEMRRDAGREVKTSPGAQAEEEERDIEAA